MSIFIQLWWETTVKFMSNNITHKYLLKRRSMWNYRSDNSLCMSTRFYWCLLWNKYWSMLHKTVLLTFDEMSWLNINGYQCQWKPDCSGHNYDHQQNEINKSFRIRRPLTVFHACPVCLVHQWVCQKLYHIVHQYYQHIVNMNFEQH